MARWVVEQYRFSNLGHHEEQDLEAFIRKMETDLELCEIVECLDCPGLCLCYVTSTA